MTKVAPGHDIWDSGRSIEAAILSGSGKRLKIPDKCLFCSKDFVMHWQDKVTESGTFRIWKCGSCRSGFVWPRPDDSDLAAHYASPAYAPRTRKEVDSIDNLYYPTSWGDADIIISRCDELAKGRSFLDVGAGNGTFSRVATNRGFRVSAIEPNENESAVFYEVNGFRPQRGFFDRAFAEQRGASYDVTLLSQVLEHMSHPLDTVNNLHTVLRPGGIAAIAIPHFGSLLSRLQGANDMYISPPDHLNFFSRSGLTKLFVKNGFRLRLVETVSKVPRRRIERLARLRPLGALGWRATYAGMRVSDWFNAGMFLNAYFEKTEAIIRH